MIKIVLIDDHELVRHGVKLLISNIEEMEVIGDFRSVEDCLATPILDSADILLLDISLPGVSGMKAAAMIIERFFKLKIIILSSFKDEEYVLESMKSDIKGYVIKSSIADSIIQAIRDVYAGKVYFSDEVMDIALSRFEQDQKVKKGIKEINLTKREREVLENISIGLTNQEIADKLFISERTVEAHRSNIQKKIGAVNTADMIRKAIHLKLIS